MLKPNLPLFKTFARYYEQPTLEACSELLCAVDTFDFKDWAGIQDRLLDEFLKLRPTGEGEPQSSNSGRAYLFGPHVGFWKRAIETRLRWFYSKLKSRPHIHLMSVAGHPQRAFLKSRKVPSVLRIGEELSVMLLDVTKDLDRLIALTRGHFEEYQTPVNVVANPHIFNELSYIGEFLDFLSEEQVLALTVVNSPPLVRSAIKQVVPFNDQMIDWSSGLNFYTCGSGHKHFLPIFARRDGIIYNLLNLAGQGHSGDDHFCLTEERVFCGCGRWRIPFSFFSHYRRLPTGYDERIIDRLTGRYKYLQFVEGNSGLEVYYEGVAPESDFVVMSASLGSLVLKPGQIYKVGSKIPTYWRTNDC